MTTPGGGGLKRFCYALEISGLSLGRLAIMSGVNISCHQPRRTQNMRNTLMCK